MQTMTTGMEQAAEIHQGFSPLLMQANYILSLSQTELEATIHDALDENPALELEECPVCPVCGRRTSGEACQACRLRSADATISSRTDDLPPRSDAEYKPASSADPDFDPMTFIASAMDVRDQILESALASLTDDVQRAMAFIIVDALDDRGFLTLGLDEIAEQVDAEPEDVEDVLLLIQEISPPGVAARSLQESLLLQAHFLRREGHAVPSSVEAVLCDHLEALGAKRLSRSTGRLPNRTVPRQQRSRQIRRPSRTRGHRSAGRNSSSGPCGNAVRH
jgi:RNA polymerase sigma-54 factor